MVLLANIPQLPVSMAFFLYNAILTAYFLRLSIVIMLVNANHCAFPSRRDSNVQPTISAFHIDIASRS